MKILTFDIEEWFHILDHESTKTYQDWNKYEFRIHQNMDRILSLLDLHNQKATFFCLGWIVEKFPNIIKIIDKYGFEIGCHSDKHQLVYNLNQETFYKDTKLAIDRLENLIGKKVLSYRAPGFSITKNTLWAFEILASLGIKYDSSVFPANRSHGGFPDFPYSKPTLISINDKIIKEFPISTKNLLGYNFVYNGGGYFRLFPYSLIKKWTAESDYVMTYLHPRDMDSGQPRIPGLSHLRHFKTYFGLKGAEGKLTKWLSDFEFVDISTFDRNYNWNNKINL